MKMLIPLDGSKFSEAALATAAPLAAAPGTETVLVVVIPARAQRAADPVQSLGIARTQATEYLQRVSRDCFHGSARWAVLVGADAGRQLVGFARRDKPDLIVMATHGRTGLAEVVVGSVAHRLLASGVAPMLLVRPQGLVASRGG